MTKCWRFALVLAAARLAAQTVPEVEITAEPHHHLVFQNAYVRVFQLEVPPGEATLMHRHRHDYVMVALGTTELSNQVEGTPAVTLKLQDGETEFAPGNFAHLMRNLASTSFRNVTIELMLDEKTRQSPATAWDEERGLEVLDRGTKEILFVKDGVRVSETELQPGGMIPKRHHAGPHLAVAITDMDLQSDVVDKGPSKIELKAGEARWFPGDFIHTVTNVGRQETKFVTLEFR
jgi:quercetin dioxygenase-like cupin family protein